MDANTVDPKPSLLNTGVTYPAPTDYIVNII